MPRIPGTPEGEAPSADAIAERAYAFYLERGGEDGHDVEDWLRAEAELRTEPAAPRRRVTTAPWWPKLSS